MFIHASFVVITSQKWVPLAKIIDNGEICKIQLSIISKNRTEYNTKTWDACVNFGHF